MESIQDLGSYKGYFKIPGPIIQYNPLSEQVKKCEKHGCTSRVMQGPE